MAQSVTTQASNLSKVFISHAHEDADLARRVADVLEASGFQTWDESRILPGDNWGEKIGEALRESGAMVVLLTSNSLHSPNVSRDIGYALGETAYKDRLIPVIAAPPEQIPEAEIPWVLRLDRFQMIRLPDKGQDEESVKMIARALQEETVNVEPQGAEPDRERGRVKWFDAEKGYGFLVRPTGEDLFVHHSEVEGDASDLGPGAEVEYEVGRNDRGPNVRSVRLLG